MEVLRGAAAGEEREGTLGRAALAVAAGGQMVLLEPAAAGVAVPPFIVG